MVIKTRQTNGTGVTNNNAPLSNSDLDNNFVELVAADAAKLENVVEDTSPELGGNLQSNGHDIHIANGDFLKIGDGTQYTTSDFVLYHDNTFDRNIIGGGSGTIHIGQDDGAGSAKLVMYCGAGAGGSTIELNSHGSTGGGQTINAAQANYPLNIQHAGSTKLSIDSNGVQTTGTINVNGAYAFPTADGTADQALTTDGSGNLSFTTVAKAPVFSSAYNSTISGITLQPNSDWKRIQVVLHADYGANFPTSTSGNTNPRLGIDMTSGTNSAVYWKRYQSDLFSHEYYAQAYYSGSSYIYYDYFNKDDVVTIEFWKVESGTSARVMFEVQFLEGGSNVTTYTSSMWNIRGITSGAVSNYNYNISINPAGASAWYGCSYMTRIEY